MTTFTTNVTFNCTFCNLQTNVLSVSKLDLMSLPNDKHNIILTLARNKKINLLKLTIDASSNRQQPSTNSPSYHVHIMVKNIMKQITFTKAFTKFLM